MLKRHAIVLALILVCAVGCASKIGVHEVGAQKTYQQINANVLSGGEPSPRSQQYLQRLSLVEKFANEPEKALADLHAGLGGLDEHDRLFALAELSFAHGERRHDSRYHRAAAVYAYSFLFPGSEGKAPVAYDPRVRQAMDLYNRGIVEGLRAEGGYIDLSPRQLSLPFGTLALAGDPGSFRYGGRALKNFASLSDYRIDGLRNQYRTPGIGAALSAQVVPPTSGQFAADRIPPTAKVPVSAFVRLDHPVHSLRNGELTGTIELYDANETSSVTIGNDVVPLEYDPSLAIAYTLQDSPLWDFAIAGFRRGNLNPFNRSAASSQTEGELYFFGPYYPGRIPVVFVHGTASSPTRWAQMANDLLGDPNIASRYQLWFFLYNSGNPVPLSSLRLREGLQSVVKEIDPEGNDLALQQMVIIGHSQGGLLTKMTAVSSGDQFWNNISESKFEMAKLSLETKDLLQRGLFVEPLPFVKRLIFISTPHRGSFMAENWLGKLSRRFVTLPRTMTQVGADLINLDPSGAKESAFRIPTSIDNMNWSNPFLRTLSSLPIDPGVTAHSIIPVKGDKPLNEKSNDGVVRYSSAHIEGVESEFIVRNCDHSAQLNPRAIEEVRRILYEHADIEEKGI